MPSAEKIVELPLLAEAVEEPEPDVVARFAIRYSRYLDPKGNAVRPLPDFAAEPAELVALYRGMVLARAFDAKAVALQRTGRLGTFPSALGQEAVAVGIAAAMRKEDVFLPSFREHGAQLWRGVSLVELFLFWGGDERGSDFAEAREDFPICVPVGTHAPHAVGVALAFKLRQEKRVAVCAFGDGATSKGDVAEALNMAGVWHLPLVFVINNNHWAISVPVTQQTAAETLAQKAVAAGIEGEQVDGNDVVAVREAVDRAVAKARAGGGPTLIEALTYRLSDHTTADDARRYRSDVDVSPHWAEDPITRLRNYLVGRGIWAKADEEALLSEAAAAVDKAAETYLATPPQSAETIFDFTYETLPKDLVEQRRAALATERE
ncbi:MAG: pyruvate dehydrogenase (acetyl-transferring) E1 component subunit alpha [Alphaproteobacteria bacterium]|nr:MAG: pyruvate dehydrogenase (acetyl-transferring) E1 component subunit alpha [Alphaproteobacteria bacterium]